ncbi:MAG: hypothetical protein ACREVO_11275 [Steroidobacteraceae bacterium]
MSIQKRDLRFGWAPEPRQRLVEVLIHAPIGQLDSYEALLPGLGD